MRVYRFLDRHYGLKTVKERKLKISLIDELNDPFEFLAANLSDEIFRGALIKTKEGLSKNRGIICFSSEWDNPVMWGHYSEKHKGICLGFNIPVSVLSKVTYIKERIAYDSEITEAQMHQILNSKFAH